MLLLVAVARCPQGRVEWLSNDLVNMLQISLAAAVAVGATAARAAPGG